MTSGKVEFIINILNKDFPTKTDAKSLSIEATKCKLERQISEIQKNIVYEASRGKYETTVNFIIDADLRSILESEPYDYDFTILEKDNMSYIYW